MVCVGDSSARSLPGRCTMLADLAAHELGRQRVGALVEHRSSKAPSRLKPPMRQRCLERGLALLGRGRQRRHRVRRQLAAEAAVHAPVALAKARVVGLDARFEARGPAARCAPAPRRRRCAGTRSVRRACCAMIGIACTADEPVPTTATRWPLKSTGSCGQSRGVQHRARQSLQAVERRRVGRRQRPARHHQEARASSARRPRVRTRQRCAASSNCAPVTRVFSRMPSRRPKRSATWLA